MKLFLASLVTISLLVPVGCSTSLPEKVVITSSSQTIGQKENIQINALFGDGSKSFKEMKNRSVLVGVFKVIKVEQVSEFAVAAKVQTLKTWKGKTAEQIIIPQIGQIEDGEVLDEGKTYVLFLDYDTPGKMHILGGLEGLFTVKDSKAYTHSWSSEIGNSITLEDLEAKVKNQNQLAILCYVSC